MMRLVLLALVVCAGASPGATTTLHAMRFGSEADRGLFADDVDADGVIDLVAVGRRTVSVYPGRRGTPPPFRKEPIVASTGLEPCFVDIADVAPQPGKEVVILRPRGVWCFVQEGGRVLPQPIRLLECPTTRTFRPLAR